MYLPIALKEYISLETVCIHTAAKFCAYIFTLISMKESIEI